MSRIGNYLVGKNEENEDDYMASIINKESDYTFNEVQEMSSNQFSDYFYRWMDENTND